MKNNKSCNEIELVRASSRAMVRELGFLEDTNSLIGVSLPQTHVLLELHRRGALTPAELAGILRVNKSSTSRSIQKLCEQGWVCDSKDKNDKRQRPVELTKEGKEKVKSINSVCDDLISTAFKQLSAEERSLVLQGLNLFNASLKKARNKSECIIRPIRKQDNAALSRLIHAVLKEFGITVQGSPLEDEEISSLYESYTKAGSSFFVAQRSKEIVGGIGLAPLKGASPEVCELRKFYVLPEVRGVGIGKLLLDSCLLAAEERGYRRIVLETNDKFKAAIKLFEQAGFKKRDKPLSKDNHSQCGLFYEKEV